MLHDWSGFRELAPAGPPGDGPDGFFHIRYEDINDVEVLNGLAAFLGSEHRLSGGFEATEAAEPGQASKTRWRTIPT
jgi:hypothetical protein